MSSPRLRTSLLALLLASPAGAGSLVSPAVEPPSDGNLTCYVVNAGSAAREVVVEVLALSGQSLDSYTWSLAPGQMGGLNSTDDQARYCRFGYQGSKKTLRASVAARDADGVPLAALEAH